MLSVDDALARLLSSVDGRARDEERVPLDEAVGRVLARDLVAAGPLPPFDASTMDGWALRAADAADGPLPAVGESRAGAPPSTLAPGTAMRIFTGAPLPGGADAVVPQEDATLDGGRVTFAAQPVAGRFLRRRGEELEAGARALTAGTRLGPLALALVAALDRAEVVVHARPRVAILPTGDEVRPAGSATRPGSVPDAVGPTLLALARAAGAVARREPALPDDRAAIARALAAHAEACDVVVTIGGVSVGDHDLVKPALEDAGFTLDFWRIALKPGKPLLVARRGATTLVGLPGNPASAAVGFALFVAPLLRALGGDAHPAPDLRPARLAAPVRHAPGRLEAVRAVWDGETVRVLSQQASGAVTSLAEANALALLAAETEHFEAGTPVRVLPL